jgi:membrane-bound serine protease (ClpP class)
MVDLGVAMHPSVSSTWRSIGIRLAALLLAALALIVTDPARGQTAPAPASGPVAVPADIAATNIAIITIKGPIDKITALSVKRRLQSAARAGADTVVIELDTPGGELGAVLDICDSIDQSKIPRIFAWVNTQAYSGGAIIALACKKIFVSDPASFGDALPISMSFGMLNELPEAERQKALVPLLAQVVYAARKNGYDEYLVQAIVSRNVELWLVEDTRSGKRWCVDRAEYELIFGQAPSPAQPLLTSAKISASTRAAQPAAPPAVAPAPDPNAFRGASPQLQQLSSKIGESMKADIAGRRPIFSPADKGAYRLVDYVCDGNGPIVLKAGDMVVLGLAQNGTLGPPAAVSPAITTDAELSAHLGARNLIRLDQRWSETAIGYLTSLPVRALLVVVFLVALFVEMTHPGVMLPGAIAGFALLGLLAPPMLIGMANWVELLAIIVGIILLAVEIFLIPGFGVAGILGLLLLVGGLVATFIPEASVFPDTPERQSETLYGLATLVLALVTSVVAMYYISKNFGALPIANRLILKSPEPSDDEDGLLLAMDPGDPEGPKVGEVGVAITPLRPAGRVQIGERVVDVVAEMGFIEPGASVRVVSVSEFRVVVEPTPIAPPDRTA